MKRANAVPAVAIQTKLDLPRPSASELEAHLRAHIFATRIPATWYFVDELPRTASMKVEYSAVRELFSPSPDWTDSPRGRSHVAGGSHSAEIEQPARRRLSRNATVRPCAN